MTGAVGATREMDRHSDRLWPYGDNNGAGDTDADENWQKPTKMVTESTTEWWPDT